ncbi:TXND3 protein, partial [Rhinopomastus cyanomelas]|nr:TXND3 protein [Rhinopomastus cyanomelas]
ILFQLQITSQAQWDEMLLMKGVVVVDVYQAWCGPCKAVVNLFRKLKTEFSEDDVLHFAVTEADSIPALKPLRNTCEPTFLFCVNGKIIAMVRGANAPLLSKKITELVQEERDIANGLQTRAEVLTKQIFNCVFILINIFTGKLFFPEELLVKYSVGIIKPDDVLEGRVEEIKQKITDVGFNIEAAEEKMLTEEQIRVFYARNTDQPDFEDFVQFMMSGPCHILAITKREAADDIPQGEELAEPIENESEEAEAEKADGTYIFKKSAVNTSKETVETESLLNICDVQDSEEDDNRLLALFFPNLEIKKRAQKVERTLALIRPSLLKERRDSILQRIKDDGFQIAMQKEIVLTEELTRQFYKEYEDQDYFPVLLEQMTSGPTLVLALARENAVAYWRDLLGPKTVEEAQRENPDSLRAKYAVDNVPIGQLHGSSTLDAAQKELEFFFPQEHTLALIKPAAAATHKDDIMEKVKAAGFTISKLKEEALTHEMAEQFYNDHKGKPFFEQLVNSMTEGPSVIMILTKENAVEEWRQLMGPTDPEVAKEISPESIRAQFAQDILCNAVHGSSN